MPILASQRLRHWDDDRRSGVRYPISAELSFKVRRAGKVVQTGSGRTVDFGSHGLLFRVDGPPPCAGKMELSIAWPIPLNEKVGLNLCVTGRTVRVEGRFAAVSFERYVFRVRARRASEASGPAPQPRMVPAVKAAIAGAGE